MANQVAFKDENNQLIAYNFENGQLFCSNGDIVQKSANEWRKRTTKGGNLKVTDVTKSNWKRTARQHADQLGFFKSVNVLTAERLDFDNLPQPQNNEETIFQVIDKWSRS